MFALEDVPRHGSGVTAHQFVDAVVIVLLLALHVRVSALLAYMKTNEARTDALMKAITGSKFPS